MLKPKSRLFSTLLALVLALTGCSQAQVKVTSTTTSPVAVRPVTTQTETPVLIPLPTQQPECQQISPSESQFQGNLLFYEYDSSIQPGVSRVWLWSKDMQSPRLVLEKPSKMDIQLSPDGTKLALHEWNSDTFEIYDVETKEAKEYTWQDTWQSISDWAKDGSLIVDRMEKYGVGITTTQVNFDEATQSINTDNVFLNLPGYSKDQTDHDPQFGFAVTDPTNSFVLYTSINDASGKLILKNIQSGETLWQSPAEYPFYPYPDWTADGSKVAYVLFSKDRGFIYELSRDGKTINKIGEGQPQTIIRELQWSPDSHYLYYADWKTITNGPGYVLDLASKEVKEICASDFLFLKGSWLRDNQFAYVLDLSKDIDKPGVGELRILDPATLSFTTLFKTNKKMESPYDIRILGETSISNP